MPVEQRYHLQELTVIDGNGIYWRGSAWCATLADAYALAEDWLADPGGNRPCRL